MTPPAALVTAPLELRERRLGVIRNLVLFGFVAAVAFHYVQGVYLERPYPRNTFLFLPGDRFMDYYNPLTLAADRNPYDVSAPNAWGRNYPPLGYLVAYLFSFYRPWALQYGFVFVTFLVCLAALNGRYLWLPERPWFDNLTTVGVLTLLPYPVIFLLDRGNWDLFVFLLLAGFVGTWLRGRYGWSAVLLGIAAALKGFPLLFALLFLREKRYREALLTVGLTAGLTLGSLALFQGGVAANLRNWAGCLAAYNRTYVASGVHAEFSNSLFGMINEIFQRASPRLVRLPDYRFGYALMALIILGLATDALIRAPLPRWVRVTGLTALVILLPFPSVDYRLVILLVPIWLYVNVSRPLRFDLWYAIIFGLLLIPKAYVMIESRPSLHANLGVIVNPLLLVALLVLLAVEFWPRDQKKNPNGTARELTYEAD